MTKTNGSKVDWKSLHEEMKDQSEEREQMERRLIEAFAAGCRGIREDMLRYHSFNDARVKCAEEDIVGLKLSDKQWGGFNAILASAITGLGLWLGKK